MPGTVDFRDYLVLSLGFSSSAVASGALEPGAVEPAWRGELELGLGKQWEPVRLDLGGCEEPVELELVGVLYGQDG